MRAACEAAERAYQINPLTESTIATARLVEITGALDEDTIIERYVQGIQLMLGLPSLPLSDFWMETELRQQAVQRYLENPNTPDDIRYRVWIAHGEVERAYALVTDEPQSAAQYWVAGEYTLTVEDDPQQADALFTEAIQRARKTGDYYASRARARLHYDPKAARRDLNLAILLGTRFEYPNAIRARITDDPGMREDLLRRALPGRRRSYAFSGVLYERRFSDFDLLPEVRFPGPGAAALLPWYTLAELYREAGRMDDARSVYEAILDVAPEEELAREQVINESNKESDS
jgi:tetratricopeptide (TPR) repeat protein